MNSEYEFLPAALGCMADLSPALSPRHLHGGIQQDRERRRSQRVEHLGRVWFVERRRLDLQLAQFGWRFIDESGHEDPNVCRSVDDRQAGHFLSSHPGGSSRPSHDLSDSRAVPGGDPLVPFTAGHRSVIVEHRDYAKCSGPKDVGQHRRFDLLYLCR